MSEVLASTIFRPQKRNHSNQMKELGEAAATIVRRHAKGEIDAYEAARQLEALKTRHRTWIDVLVG